MTVGRMREQIKRVDDILNGLQQDVALEGLDLGFRWSIGLAVGTVDEARAMLHDLQIRVGGTDQQISGRRAEDADTRFHLNLQGGTITVVAPSQWVEKQLEEQPWGALKGTLDDEDAYWDEREKGGDSEE